MIVVSANSVSGRTSQRTGSLQLSAGVVSLKRLEKSELNITQRQSLSADESADSISIVQPGEVKAAAMVAHDGTEAQVSRTRGALTFRLGDFFSGADKEQMRLTEDGKLGIGTSNPQATLDVVGDVRASGTITAQKIEFPDGTVQTTAVRENANAGGNTNNITGTGTQNQVAKWVDNAGALGDSAITEVGGNVGIANTAPSYRLSVGPNYGAGLSFAAMTVSKGAGQSVSMLVGPSYGLGAELGWDNAGARGFVNVVGGPLAFMNNFSEKMRIDQNGFVGIGTTTPGFPLDVLGTINAMQYNLNGLSFLRAPGTNTFVGTSAGAGNTTGSGNSFFGFNAGVANMTGSGNSFFGTSAGQLNTADSNTFIGFNAGGSNTSGFSNSFLGRNAGFSNTTASINTFVGYNAGLSNTTGTFNSFFGATAGVANTATSNSFFGALAGASNTSGGGNSFFGRDAGASNTTGGSNAFFGLSAGRSNTTASFNSFFGASAGGQNTTGAGNSFFGTFAGNDNVSGDFNSFFGASAGGDNTTGESNAFFGNGSGFSNTTASNNSFFGTSAGNMNTTGAANTFVGKAAGVLNTTGGSNAFFGTDAGFNNKTGTGNTFVGRSAGQANTAGVGNIVIGHQAGGNLVTGSNNIYVANAGGTDPESGTIRIGSALTHNAAYIEGIFNSPVPGGIPVFVDPTGKLGTAPSSRRFKQDIHNMGSLSSRLMQLRPVTYLYRPEMVPGADHTLQYGLIAEEVEKVYPEMVQHTADGQVLTVRYQMLNSMLLNEVQKQQQVIQSQQQLLQTQTQKNATQEQRITTQEQQISDLEQRLRRLETAVTARPKARRRSTQNRVRSGQ